MSISFSFVFFFSNFSAFIIQVIFTGSYETSFCQNTFHRQSGNMHLPSVIIIACVVIIVSFFISPSFAWVIPAERLGELLIPLAIQSSGMSIFNLGKMIGARERTNYGVHGGPIHHVFPVVHKNPSPPFHHDDDEDDYRQPTHHKAVVDAHYTEGKHIHYNSWN